MRLLRTGLLGMAALSMAATPVLAAEVNPAAKLSIAGARAGAPQGKAKLAGGGFLIAAIAVVAVIAGVVIVATDDDDSN